MDNIIFDFLTILFFILLITAIYIMFRLIFYSFFKTKRDFLNMEENNITKEKNDGQK